MLASLPDRQRPGDDLPLGQTQDAALIARREPGLAFGQRTALHAGQNGGGRRDWVAGQQQAGLQRGPGVFLQCAEGGKEIGFFHMRPGLQQAVIQPAVVRQQQKTLGIPVEPADGVQVLQRGGQKGHDRRPVGVAAGRQVAAGLVEHIVRGHGATSLARDNF